MEAITLGVVGCGLLGLDFVIQIDFVELDVAGFVDDGSCLAVPSGEAGAQALVALDEVGDGSFEMVHIELATEVEGRGHVIGG